MRRPGWLWAGLLWLAVVVAVSAVTWTVIDSAGQDVLGEDRTSTGAAADGSTASASPPTGSPSPSRTRKPSPTPSASGAPSRTPSSTGAPSSAPATTAPGTPSATPPASSPPPSPAPQPPQTSPAAKVATWQGAAGSVTVRCEASRVSLVSATPSDGWKVEVEKRGPEEVEVEFKTGGEDEREVRVEARCSAGEPRFDVESDNGDGEDGESEED